MLDEDRHDAMATQGDAMREFAANVGMDNPDRPWVLTDYDVWMRNPFYCGPSVPHPEDESHPQGW